MAARRERGLFDPDAAPGESPFDHHIYVIAGDGCMEEGVSSEASSLAGHQQLGNLILFYDDNHISIEDDTAVAFSEDVAARYEAYGWHVQYVDSGEDVVALENAIAEAKKVVDKPSFIVVRTIIGWPAPTLQNTGKAHGAALGDDEIAKTKEILGFPPDVDVRRRRRRARPRPRGHRPRPRRPRRSGSSDYDAWAEGNPAGAELHERLNNRTLPDGWTDVAARVPDREGRQAQRHLHPQGVGRGAQRAGRRAARAVGRLGRPRREQQHDDGGRAELHPGRAPDEDVARRPVRAHAALRHPRARHGRDPQRHHAARRHPRLRRHVPGVQRLHAPAGPAGRADEAAVDLRVDARLDRPRRRRPDPPADRAPRRAAGDPGPRRRPPGRRQRDRGRAGAASSRRPTARPVWRCRGRTCRCSTRRRPPTPAAGAYVLEEAIDRARRGHPHRHRLRGRARPEGPRAARGRRHPDPGRVDAVRRVVRGPAARPTSSRCCRPRSRPGSASRPASRRAGARSSATPARSISIEHFGASAEGDVLFEQFGFTPDRVVAAAHSAHQPRRAHPREHHRQLITASSKETDHERRTGPAVRRRRLDLARRHQPRAPAHRQPAGPRRRQARRRRHQQPDDLPEGPREGRRLRRAGPRPRAAQDRHRRGDPLPDGLRHPLGLRRAAAGLRRAPTASTAGSRSRSTRAWPTTPTAPPPRPRRCGGWSTGPTS